MRITMVSLLAVALSCAQTEEQPLMNTGAMFAHYDRMLQLIDATTATTPGLARAAAPILESARQTVNTLRVTNRPQEASLHYQLLRQTQSYLALADALPKPHPFPETGRKQFTELREALDRADAHFRALLDLKERQIRNPDRDALARYADANARTNPPQAGKHRVVFLGDSITDGWRINEYFPNEDYINRGISGQITGQMLGRMQADVIAHKPRIMVLLAGTNDIARGVPVEAIQNNIAMIADLAAANKIKPVLASILPIHDYNKEKDRSFERSPQRPPQTIKAINDWLRGFCRQRGYPYLDYFASMVDENGFLKQDLAADGLHPNSAGYRVMAPLAAEAITKALPAAPPPQEKKRRGLFR